MPDPKTNPPVQPTTRQNPPKDPGVYGGHWGDTGGAPKPAGQPPPDRPDKIRAPPEKA
jgi:hypothetical protein